MHSLIVILIAFPCLAISEDLDISTVISFLRNPTATVNCLNTCTTNTDGPALVATLNDDMSCTCSEAIDTKVLLFDGVLGSLSTPACDDFWQWLECSSNCYTGKGRNCEDGWGYCNLTDCQTCLYCRNPMFPQRVQ